MFQLTAMEGTHDNENEPLTFTSLAVAAARVVDRLSPDAKQNEERADDGANKQADKKRDVERRAYVDHRLNEIRAWERRISGKG